MNKQPEALRLADSLRNTLRWHELTDDECDAAAAELLRLHSENQALNDALQYFMGCHREMSELAVRQRAHLDQMELQGEQEPIARVAGTGDAGGHFDWCTPGIDSPYLPVGTEIYTRPQPKRTQLTISQLFDAVRPIWKGGECTLEEIIRAVEIARDIK